MGDFGNESAERWGGGGRVDANLMILCVAYSEQISHPVSTNGDEFLVFKCDKCKPRGKFRGWVSG